MAELAFQRRYRCDELEIYLADFDSVSSSEEESAVGTVTVSMPKGADAYPLISAALKKSGYSDEVRFFTLDEQGEIIAGETFYLQDEQSNDLDDTTVTFSGAYCPTRLDDGALWYIFDGETSWRPESTATAGEWTQRALQHNKDRGFMSRVTIVGGDIYNVDSAGTPWSSQVALDPQMGKQFTTLLDDLYTAQKLRWKVEETPDGILLYLFNFGQGGVDRTADGPGQVAIVRGAITTDVSRVTKGSDAMSTYIVKGKYGSLARYDSMPAAAARTHGPKVRFEEVDRVYTPEDAVTYANDRGEQVTMTIDEITLSDQSTSIPGTPIPGRAYGLGDTVLQYTRTDAGWESPVVKRIDRQVIDNGTEMTFSTVLGRNLRDVRLRVLTEPTAAPTPVVDPQTGQNTQDIQDIRDQLNNGGGGGDGTGGNIKLYGNPGQIPVIESTDGAGGGVINGSVVQNVYGENASPSTGRQGPGVVIANRQGFVEGRTFDCYEVYAGNHYVMSNGSVSFKTQTDDLKMQVVQENEGPPVFGSNESRVEVYVNLGAAIGTGGQPRAILQAWDTQVLIPAVSRYRDTTAYSSFQRVGEVLAYLLGRVDGGDGGGGDGTPTYSITPTEVTGGRDWVFTVVWPGVPEGTIIYPVLDFEDLSESGQADEGYVYDSTGSAKLYVHASALVEGSRQLQAKRMDTGELSPAVTITVTAESNDGTSVSPASGYAGSDKSFVLTWPDLPDGTNLVLYWDAELVEGTDSQSMDGAVASTVPAALMTVGSHSIWWRRTDTNEVSSPQSIEVTEDPGGIGAGGHF